VSEGLKHCKAVKSNPSKESGFIQAIIIGDDFPVGSGPNQAVSYAQDEK